MPTFAPRRTSQQVDRVARVETMMNLPFTLSRNLGEQFQQGIMDSFGLGTVIRNANIPAGNTAPDMGGPLPNPVASLGRLAQNVGGMIRQDRPQPSMTEDEYKSSPYYRAEVPFQEGMTEDRAAALALFYDTRKTREYFGQMRPFSTFVGQLAGQALDPINYVPVFGPAAETAAVARMGTIGGRAVLGSVDAAVNTAAFGALTANLRDQFGDDTSWQAMTSEIAISALIGGAFGGVSGIIANTYRGVRGRADRQAEAKIADQMTDMRSMREARAALGQAVGDLAAGRDVSLTPNAAAAVERIQTAAASAAASARALADQTAQIAETARVAITPTGSRVEVRPEVVELDDLVNATGALQVRNRGTQASAAQVEQIATELDPARLMPSVDADSGAPIVGEDNVVDSGNGRVMAIRRAAEAYPDRYGAYKKALEGAGYDLTGFRNPVLISRRLTPLSQEARAQFNAEANAPRAAQMSAVEIAAMDRNALDGTLDVLDPSPITSAANRAFVQRFLGNLAPSARGALVDGAGNLNADGARRIENALVAAAYGDVDLGVLRRFAEATDDNTRTIVGAMSDVAGRWAQMRQEVKAGNISPEFDVTVELTDALRLIGRWREQAAREGRPVSVVIKEEMGQLDLLSGEVAPETQVIIAAFYKTNSFTQAAGRDTIADFLRRVVDAAEELGRPQLFGDAGVARMEVLRNAAVNEQGNLFTPVGTVDGIEADGGFSRGTPVAADREGGGQGTGESGRGQADNADGVEPLALENLGRVTDDEHEAIEAALEREIRAQSPLTPTEQRAIDDGYAYANGGPEMADLIDRGAVPAPRDLMLYRGASRADAGGDEWVSLTFSRATARNFSGGDDANIASVVIPAGTPVFSPRSGISGGEVLVRQSDFAAAVSATDGLITPSVGQPVALRDLSPEGQARAQADFVASQPARSLDELYEVVQSHQDELGRIGAELAEQTGADFRNPGIKKKATSAEKMARKRYDSTSRLTDVVRAGYVVETPDQVDTIIAGLAQRFRVLDEGWRMTEAGYFDRKAMVQFEDGTIGEVQFWHPDLLKKKDGTGHALYEEMRTATDPARKMELLDQQRRVYLESLETIGEEWLPIVDQLLDEVSEDVARIAGRPASGNMRSNASAATGRPDSMTSANSTGSQAPPSVTIAQALPSDTAAGRPSQSTSVTARSPVLIDGMPVIVRDMPDADGRQGTLFAGSESLLPNDIDDAARRVAKDESLRDLALSHGVDPKTGAFTEAGDIAQLREEGRLTPEDEAELAEADRVFADAEAWGRALDAAVRCIL